MHKIFHNRNVTFGRWSKTINDYLQLSLGSRERRDDIIIITRNVTTRCFDPLRAYKINASSRSGRSSVSTVVHVKIAARNCRTLNHRQIFQIHFLRTDSVRSYE